MTSVAYMRTAISNVCIYSSSPTWKNKVSKMSDRQVAAIYFDFCGRGLFEEKVKKPKPRPVKKIKEESQPKCVQLSFDDVFFKGVLDSNNVCPLCNKPIPEGMTVCNDCLKEVMGV